MKYLLLVCPLGILLSSATATAGAGHIGWHTGALAWSNAEVFISEYGFDLDLFRWLISLL